VTVGVQFVLWTLGGLYFSWNDLDAVHGDHLRAPAAGLGVGDGPLASPSVAVAALRATGPVDSLAGAELIGMHGRPVWRLRYYAPGPDGRPARRTRLADARTGAPRPAVGRDEAVALARAAFAPRAPVRQVEYLTAAAVGGHHEYRGQPLPAWAVRFDHPGAPTAYVAAEEGEVRRIRHARWRAFDLLWMLHTMDFRGRDDINNLALRACSALGLVTVGSGFALFGLTARARRRAGRAARAAGPARA
jgi:hypothetical protein